MTLAQRGRLLRRRPRKLLKVDRSPAVATLTRVKWLRTMAAVVLAVLWLPVSVHCQLEQVPLLDFLSCCLHEQSSPHQDNDCEADACAVIEAGLYKSEERRSPLLEPVLVSPHLASLLTDVLPRPLVGGAVLPPEASKLSGLSGSWQFTSRAALPPRAPSLAS